MVAADLPYVKRKPQKIATDGKNVQPATGQQVTLALRMGAPKVWTKAFGDLLVRLRQKAHLTQAEAAERAEIDAPLLFKYEHGERRSPDPVFLLKLAEVYCVSLRGLILALEHSRSHPLADVSEVFEVFQRENDGPSPAVAKAQIEKAQRRLFASWRALDDIINPQPGGQATEPRRRKTDRGEDD